MNLPRHSLRYRYWHWLYRVISVEKNTPFPERSCTFYGQLVNGTLSEALSNPAILLGMLGTAVLAGCIALNGTGATLRVLGITLGGSVAAILVLNVVVRTLVALAHGAHDALLTPITRVLRRVFCTPITVTD